MATPEPSSIMELLLTFKNWIAGGVTIVASWLFTRYLKQREEFEKESKNFKEEVKKEVKEALAKLTLAADNFTKQINDAKNISADMRKAVYEFQAKIMEDVGKIQHEVAQLSGKSTVMNSIVEDMSVKVKSVVEVIDKMQKRIDAHHRSLSTGAQTFVKQKDELANMKTEIQKISDELILIRDVKTPKTKGEG